MGCGCIDPNVPEYLELLWDLGLLQLLLAWSRLVEVK